MSAETIKVLVTGASGQLGRALFDTLPPGVEWLKPERRLDITDRAAVMRVVADLKPALIINAAAYTAVDKAETDAAGAYLVNQTGALNMAIATQETGARMAHISTDFIFNGRSSVPYQTDDAPDPLSVYGDSKLKGEQAVRSVLGEQALIVRTAWVHYPAGNNFVRTMTRIMRVREEVRVVADQIGSPTDAGGLAKALWALTVQGATGSYHWTDAGVASWYDFAQAIRELGAKARPQDRWARVTPIRSEDYPTPAKRPHYSVLDKSKAWNLIGAGSHWRESIELRIEDYLDPASG